MFSTTDELVAFISDTEVECVDVCFCDLPGTMHRLTVPAANLTATALDEGIAFDGSSVRGFQSIDASDLELRADLGTGRIDPFRKRRTLALNVFVHDPLTHDLYSRDPRNVARKAEAYLAGSGIADTVFIGSEAEFYVFDEVRFGEEGNGAFYRVDAEAGAWNSGREQSGGNLGFKIRPKSGYLAASPRDRHHDLRNDIVAVLSGCGFLVERAHHEVGAGQGEINYRFNTLLAAADDLMFFKYVVKNVAWAAGMSATFMPRPLPGDNGSGLHCHQSLWSGGAPLFFDEAGYAGLSDLARHYVGGILHHAPSLLAFTNPTLNSYRRLVPGFEAPVNLVYSSRNRSACIRIPITGSNPAAKRIEFRCPDPSGNPYLSFAAQLMAGLDGVRRRIQPPEPIDTDLYHLPPEVAGSVVQVPHSLEAALEHLQADHAYLLEGDVFTPDLLEMWIRMKFAEEIEPIRSRPHPHEFGLYYDI